MDIRFADEKDLDQIANVYIKNHRSTYKGLLSDEYLCGLTFDYGRNKWEAYLRDESKKIWAAYEETLFLGFAAGMEDAELDRTWYLDSLHVTEDARGKGVGTALIRTVGQYAREHHYNRMSICIVKGNEAAGGLYRRLGARHFKDFEDLFAGTVSHSEKLLWEPVVL
ncbi:MAG: GNAT family N-acetyltransferase [Lachnospiraceae bacterium]|nr:GNAT family N-acetyltransferase [Lachnospiraceae bacterium]